MNNYPKAKTTADRFYNDIISWYHACEYPQALIDDIMKSHQPKTLGPYLQATPQTVARIFIREYAFNNELVYDGIEEHLISTFNQRKGSKH